MITVLEYLVIAAAIAAVVFVVAVFVFGRGERMAPLPAQTSPAELPDRGITAQDVHRVKFAMALRGYRMSDVDWTLERLALRIEELTKEVGQLRGTEDPVTDGPESDRAAGDAAEDAEPQGGDTIEVDTGDTVAADQLDGERTADDVLAFGAAPGPITNRDHPWGEPGDQPTNRTLS